MASPREAWRQARERIAETENACLERLMDLQERGLTLAAKQTRLDAIVAEIHAKRQSKEQHERQCNEYRKMILDVQKAMKEEVKKRAALTKMKKDLIQTVEELRDSTAHQREAFHKELEEFRAYRDTVAAFLKASAADTKLAEPATASPME